MRARAEDRATPNDLTNTFIRAANGDLVPLSSFVTLSESAAPQTLNRLDRLRSITIQSSLAPGVSIGDGLAKLEEIVRENLPPEARIGYTGQSKEFRDSTGAIYLTFGMALLVVFLVLAAQFESWINPFIIMLTVPLAVTGGLAALVVTGQTLNIYSQIGMILLIGLMTKNGILIVEFANQLRERGYSVRDAVIEASVLRLRPILMTSIAMIGGAIPLAWSTGAGAEARNAIGSVIVGGVALSTLLTVLVVPSIYLLIGGFTKPPTYVSEMLDKLRAETGLRRTAKSRGRCSRRSDRHVGSYGVRPPLRVAGTTRVESDVRCSPPPCGEGQRGRGFAVPQCRPVDHVARADADLVRVDLVGLDARTGRVDARADVAEADVAVSEVDHETYPRCRWQRRPSAPRRDCRSCAGSARQRRRARRARKLRGRCW